MIRSISKKGTVNHPVWDCKYFCVNRRLHIVNQPVLKFNDNTGVIFQFRDCIVHFFEASKIAGWTYLISDVESGFHLLLPAFTYTDWSCHCLPAGNTGKHVIFY